MTDDRKVLTLNKPAKVLTPHPDDVSSSPSVNPLEKILAEAGVVPVQSKRIEEVKTERRRRADTSNEFTHRLSVNHALLDHGKYAYRFVNDTSGRLHELTVNDDWDVVKDPSVKTDNNNEGAPVRKLVGANQDGSPVYAFLCRKPLQYHKDDRKRKSQRTDELMAQIKRGAVKSPDGAAALDKSTTYIPDGGISITQAKGKVSSFQP